MFVVTPHPSFVHRPAWIVWIASDTTLRVLRPGAGPEKKSTLLFPPPAESTGTQQRAREMRLSSALFELYKKQTVNYTVVCAPVSCVQLCTSTGTNLYNLNLRFTVRHARLSRSQKVLSCAQAAQLVARYSLASPVNFNSHQSKTFTLNL